MNDDSGIGKLASEPELVGRERIIEELTDGIPDDSRKLVRYEAARMAAKYGASQAADSHPSPKDEAPVAGIFRFRQLMNLKVDRPKEIIKGLIYERQSVMLIGRFGIGKTMLGTQLSLHLASGREFLGLGVPRRYRTMYLDLENDLGDIKDRLSKQTEALQLSEAERDQLDEHWIYVDAGNEHSPLHGIKLDNAQAKLEPLIGQLNQHGTDVVFIR